MCAKVRLCVFVRVLSVYARIEDAVTAILTHSARHPTHSCRDERSEMDKYVRMWRIPLQSKFFGCCAVASTFIQLIYFPCNRMCKSHSLSMQWYRKTVIRQGCM